MHFIHARLRGGNINNLINLNANTYSEIYPA